MFSRLLTFWFVLVGVVCVGPVLVCAELSDDDQITMRSLPKLREEMAELKSIEERRPVGRRIVQLGASLAAGEMSKTKASTIGVAIKAGTKPTQEQMTYTGFWLIRAMGAVAADDAAAGMEAALVLKKMNAAKLGDLAMDVLASLQSKGWLAGADLAQATKEKPFINFLGQEFVPVAATPGLLWCRWETRVQDYAAYCRAKGITPEQPSFSQTGEHPVVNVSLEDARAFVKWLTAKEGITYRLPSDHEWSGVVGIGNLEQASDTPQSKDGKIKNRYPWGTTFPPPAGMGNFGSSLKVESLKVDSFANTAPVGNFTGNAEGIYDLAGNVWEWCETPYSKTNEYWVLRGGCWDNYDSVSLRSSCRNIRDLKERKDGFGFRVVVAVGGGG